MPQRAELKMNLGKIKAAERAGAIKGLQVAAEHLLQVSREQVPHEEGTLERSGDPAERPGAVSVADGELRAAVSYDTVYAVRQHEELTWKHDEGRKAKYLEDPMNSERQVMGEIVAAEIRRSLR
ncbi:hypothetical protein [Streptosporangium sp. NPDC051022]|uniref:hypothetical protein n=1 Tax=Streptosporangium sp. NPDC051022 TaxID=3155752 RepID=UPI00342097DE